jgi:hypothetical protein
LRTISGAIFIACIGLGSIENALAQSVDNTPPVIELEELVEGVADLSQVFTVQIAEDGFLRDATLYYRRAGQQPYTPVAMEPLGTSGFFSVSITTEPDDLRAIEYYVQARDEAGNRSVSGFAFEPYVRQLRAADPVTQRTEVDTGTQPLDAGPTPLLERRWFQVTLGIVVVGVAAAVLSDGGGEDTELVPVTINLE